MSQFRLKTPRTEIIDSKNIFTLFTALNAVGYDDENNPSGMSTIRKQVRFTIKKYNIKMQYSVIAKVLKKHHPWYLINKILTVKNYYLIKKFSQEQVVENLWKITKDNRAKEINKITPIFQQEVVRLVKFFGKTPQNIKKIVLMINPLDAYWRGYAMKIKSTGYIIVGPGAEKNNGELISHELLHLLVPFFKLPKSLVVILSSPDTVNYIGYKVKNRECVVRALDLLYQKQILNINIDQSIKREEKYFPHIRRMMAYLENKIKQSHS